MWIDSEGRLPDYGDQVVVRFVDDIEEEYLYQLVRADEDLWYEPSGDNNFLIYGTEWWED
jgi:hypothetical protein